MLCYSTNKHNIYRLTHALYARTIALCTQANVHVCTVRIGRRHGTHMHCVREHTHAQCTQSHTCSLYTSPHMHRHSSEQYMLAHTYTLIAHRPTLMFSAY